MIIDISVSWALLDCCDLTLNGMSVKYFPEQAQSKITNSPNPEQGQKLKYVKLRFINICEGRFGWNVVPGLRVWKKSQFEFT